MRVWVAPAGRPPVRVISHDAIAFERYRSGASGPLLVVTDARRREVYWSAYSGVDDAGLAREYGVQGIPALFAFTGGKVVARQAGLSDAGLFRTWVDRFGTVKA